MSELHAFSFASIIWLQTEAMVFDYLLLRLLLVYNIQSTHPKQGAKLTGQIPPWWNGMGGDTDPSDLSCCSAKRIGTHPKK